MYYKFSPMANRLVASSVMQAYHPQGLLPASKVKIIPIQMNYKPVSVSQVEGIPRPTERLPPGPGIPGRDISSTAQMPQMPRATAPGGMRFAPVDPKFAELQQKFQRKDGLPIHLKGGQTDYILYYTILGGCTLTTLWSLYLFYQMSFPKKPAEE